MKLWPRPAVSLVAALFALLATSTLAQQRVIRLNGAWLTPQQIYQLDSIPGRVVPNGAYWLDFDNGMWGYEGDPRVQGTLPGWGVNRRTPGGDIIGDGKCTFVAGVPVGDCD